MHNLRKQITLGYTWCNYDYKCIENEPNLVCIIPFVYIVFVIQVVSKKDNMSLE